MIYKVPTKLHPSRVWHWESPECEFPGFEWTENSFVWVLFVYTKEVASSGTKTLVFQLHPCGWTLVSGRVPLKSWRRGCRTVCVMGVGRVKEGCGGQCSKCNPGLIVRIVVLGQDGVTCSVKSLALWFAIWFQQLLVQQWILFDVSKKIFCFLCVYIYDDCTLYLNTSVSHIHLMLQWLAFTL